VRFIGLGYFENNPYNFLFILLQYYTVLLSFQTTVSKLEEHLKKRMHRY